VLVATELGAEDYMYLATITEDGFSGEELGGTFTLGNSACLADEYYLYTYSESLNGYSTAPIDITLNKHNASKTNIYGYPVVAIMSSAFAHAPATEISIADSIITISDEAFLNIFAPSMTIPDSVATIGNKAFYTAHIENLVIGSGVTRIGVEAFSSTDIVSLTFSSSSSLTDIAKQAFYGCVLISSLEIPEGVLNIGEKAFCNNTMLTSLKLPGSLTSIGRNAFADCNALTSITFNGTCAQWNAIEGSQYELFKQYSGEAGSHIPATYIQCLDGTVAI
jgi:hypothetical protein